jgi:GxxExxY protein
MKCRRAGWRPRRSTTTEPTAEGENDTGDADSGRAVFEHLNQDQNKTDKTDQTCEADYRGFTREESLRFDLFVDECLLVEAKAVQEDVPIHKAQLLSYMKLLSVPLGLVINFHEIRLTDGVARLILPGANR